MSTPCLSLPLLAAGQAQKHVTLNEALIALDGITQLAVLDVSRTEPPASPDEGDRHIIAGPATGAWAGRQGEVAQFQDGFWTYRTPRAGWIAWVATDGELRIHDGTGWTSALRAARLGLGATPDAANRLAVASPASLFTGGSGGHQLKINKGMVGATASLLYQTGFSGRAEIGLTGDDRLSFKTSPDGTVWREALACDPQTGTVSLPLSPQAVTAPNLVINGDFAINQRSFAGGALAAGTYGFDRWRAGPGGASLTAASGVATLASGMIEQPIEAAAFGLPSLAGKIVTISVGDPGADMLAEIAGAQGSIAAGTGRRSVTLTIPAAFSGTPVLKLSRQNGAGVSFGAVKLELGEAATAFVPRPRSVEEILAQRYFCRLTGPFSLFLYAQAAGNYFFNSLQLPVRMRISPTITRVLGTSGNLFQNNTANAATSALGPASIRLSVRANGAGECYANFDQVDCDAEMA